MKFPSKLKLCVNINLRLASYISNQRTMIIREAKANEFDDIWLIFHEIVSVGETYAYPREMTKVEAKKAWLELPRKTYVAEEDQETYGTYYIKTNQLGGGNHVCNCGYMVSAKARGKGVATAMCEHSQNIAIELGYKAMQFNFVVSTNESAIRLWEKLGFSIVGRLPKAFMHASKGYVDALVMYKWLETQQISTLHDLKVIGDRQ